MQAARGQLKLGLFVILEEKYSPLKLKVKDVSLLIFNFFLLFRDKECEGYLESLRTSLEFW